MNTDNEILMSYTEAFSSISQIEKKIKQVEDEILFLIEKKQGLRDAIDRGVLTLGWKR